MNVQDAYTIVVTDSPEESRDYWVTHLGFEVAFEADWFVYLVSEGEPRFGVAFMRSGLDHQRADHRLRYDGGGATILSLQVGDAKAVFDQVTATGATPLIDLRDEPWGQRHFLLVDPSGVHIDIVEQIEPDPSFFDPDARQSLDEALGVAERRG